MCDQDLTDSLDTLIVFFLKIALEAVIHDACGTWHSLCTVTSIHSIKKGTRNSQKLENKLVGLVSEYWQKIQLLKLRKNELISKKVWRERKEKMSRLRRCCCTMWININKNCCWGTSVIRKCYILPGRWSDDEVVSFVPTDLQAN